MYQIYAQNDALNYAQNYEYVILSRVRPDVAFQGGSW